MNKIYTFQLTNKVYHLPVSSQLTGRLATRDAKKLGSAEKAVIPMLQRIATPGYCSAAIITAFVELPKIVLKGLP